jgi:hypothetical protein
VVKLITFGLLCAAALVVAAFAREDRRCIFVAALVVAVNWLLFSMPWIYNPASLAHLLVTAGMPVEHADMWAVTDLISLITVIVACRHLWWAPVLWAPYLVTLAMLAVAWCNSLEYVEYSAVLDAALVVQLATLFAVGGDGCADRMLDFCRSLRSVRNRTGKLARRSEVAR